MRQRRIHRACAPRPGRHTARNLFAITASCTPVFRPFLFWPNPCIKRSRDQIFHRPSPSSLIKNCRAYWPLADSTAPRVTYALKAHRHALSIQYIKNSFRVLRHSAPSSTKDSAIFIGFSPHSIDFLTRSLPNNRSIARRLLTNSYVSVRHANSS